MKSYINLLVVFCFALMSHCSAMTKEELIHKATQIAKACEVQESVTKQDMNEFFTHQIPTTQSGKCFRACIMESFNVLIDNKLNIENAIMLAEKIFDGNPRPIQLIRDLHDECNPISIGENRCETAFNLFKCSMESLDRRGIDHSSFYEA